LHSDEACAVRLVLFDSESDFKIDALRVVLLRRAKITVAAWRLGSRDRRDLRRIVRRGGWLVGAATDAAGNLRRISVRLRREVRAAGASAVD
jgi:hypothetical protein